MKVRMKVKRGDAGNAKNCGCVMWQQSSPVRVFGRV